LSERDILRRLDCPFIVGFVDYFEEESKYSNIVLEYCEVNNYWKLNSPFIVGFVDYFEEGSKYSNIVFEYCEVNKYYIYY